MIYLAARPEHYVIIGLSTETKPAVVANSVFLEADTGEWWIFSRIPPEAPGFWWKCGKQPKPS